MSEKGQIKILFERLDHLEKTVRLFTLTLRLHLALMKNWEREIDRLREKRGDSHEEGVQ